MPSNTLDPSVSINTCAVVAGPARRPEAIASTLVPRILRLGGRPFRPASRGVNRGRSPAARGLRVGVPAVAVLATLAWLVTGAAPALALKVATWNLLNYPDVELAVRQPNLRTAIAALDPDVIMLQELKSSAGRDSFLINVLRVVQPGQWSSTSYISSCESAVFYKPAKVTVTFSGSAIPTYGPRDVLAVRVRLAGYLSKEAELRLYSVHFKAGQPTPTPDDSATRRLECADLRNNMNLAAPTLTSNFLVGGDTNFYGDWEGGYIRLTENQADNDGRCKDPLSMPGTWNAYAYRANHTQSTCASGLCPAGWPTAGGGLDDRFDLFLTSYSLQDGEGLDLIPGGYLAYGNDGQHYNSSVNGLGFNNAVGMAVANALYYSSDHLPAVVTLQAPAKVAAASLLDFGSVIVGAGAERTLVVTNGAAVPADELNYSLSAPSGFLAPGGAFVANAGAAGNAHVVSMSTADPGVKSGALTVSCDDPDSTAKLVQLSGTVLAHAVASLDSLEVATQTAADFGTHPYGAFSDLPVRVHNAGWDPLKAKLEVAGGVITGGNGRFSIVGGFEPAEIADVGRTYALRFDDAGATADSTYEATLVFSCADEPLPGASPASDLVVTLRARPSSGPVDAAVRFPERVAFHPPGPNPFRVETVLRFDLPRPAEVSIELFDISGRRVTAILEGYQPAGSHALRWTPAADRGPLLAGLYFLRFRADGFSETRRLVLAP
jgi:endonuclease/exonuclease/phosphatase family metal-dependent hydrolase